MNTIASINNTVTAQSYECTVTVDCAVFGFQDNTLKLLLVKRSIEPFKDYWLLPGGLMDVNETLEASVNKVLFNLTGINTVLHHQVKCYSEIDRHPVKRSITVSFYALVKPENHPVIAKNHISAVSWYALDELPKLGFDHDQLVADALIELRRNLKQDLLFGELLPEKFTLKELQDLYESVLDEKLDRRNFRKKILQMDILVATDEIKVGVKGGPQLFKMKEGKV
ncbi:MAG: NUDIX hydrolase [Cyclobacteriaceae bacterium]